MPPSRNLILRLVRRGVVGQLAMAAMLFVPAGTLKYRPGWAFLIVNLLSSLLLCVYFYQHDPQLLERRLLTREKVRAQKFIMSLVKGFYGLAFILPGFDFRFGWTNQWTGPLPRWLMVSALLLVPVGYGLFVAVMRANRFAASIVQIETGQSVADAGPYRFVRHPMYAGGVLLWLATPLALGSLVALPAFALLIPLFILRLLNEEKILRRELPGYAEYCRRTPCRLVPFVW